uniref:F-box domain-containing protein n=1 Tax=Caenorhabditis tropicalis TaxID=1561998 RepID=A0A1I7UI83_9PELO
MSNHPSAIKVWLFYKRKDGKNDLYEKLCNVIGENGISEEKFKILSDKMMTEDENSSKQEIRQLVDNNQANLRLCILSDVIDKKSIIESFSSIIKMIGTHDIDDQDFEFWFNRFSSRDWNLDQKTFSDLPLFIVNNIAERSDFLARLRRVSHGLRNIVDQMAPSIDQIIFQRRVQQNTLDLTIRQLEKHESGFRWKRYFHGEDNWKKPFDGMKTILSNPRLRLKDFYWDNGHSTEINYKFMDMINSLTHKIETVSLLASLNGDLMIDLLKAIKPETLETMLFGGKFESEDIIRLADLEQWKKAKEVQFSEVFPDFSPHFHHFQHFEHVEIAVESLLMDDILFVKKLSIQNDKFKWFDIVTRNKPLTMEIKEALGISDYLYSDGITDFSGRIDIPESNDYLEVVINEYAIYFHRKTKDSE